MKSGEPVLQVEYAGSVLDFLQASSCLYSLAGAICPVFHPHVERAPGMAQTEYVFHRAGD